MNETADARETRLKRAKAFLEAGRTQVAQNAPLSETKGSETKGSETQESTARPNGLRKPKAEKADPTRYGDWEKKGRCIDF